VGGLSQGRLAGNDRKYLDFSTMFREQAMFEGGVKICAVAFFQINAFVIQNQLNRTFEDVNELFTVMAVGALLLCPFGYGNDEGLHLLVLFAVGEGFVGIPGGCADPRDDLGDGFSLIGMNDLITAFFFIFYEKTADLDVEKLGDPGQSCYRRRDVIVLNLGNKRRRKSDLFGHGLKGQLVCQAQFFDFCADIQIIHVITIL